MTLTAKQQAQVNKAPQAKKAALRAMFNKQNTNRPPAANGGKQARPQTEPRRGAPRAGPPRGAKWAFDAFDKRHLPVDEVTAPYTTTNFVGHLEFSSKTDMDQVIVVCPRSLYPQELHTGALTDVLAVVYDASETIAGTIATLDHLRSEVLGKPPLTASVQRYSIRGRLHNMSVRLGCLGTNTGLYPPGSVYVGTVPMIETGYASTGGKESLTIKQAWADDSIAVGYIKPIAASRLQERPVVLHAAVAESVSYKTWRDFAVAASSEDIGGMGFSTALEPIVLYIPRAGAGTTAVNYRLEVAQQWCTRHPHDVLLRATQKQHSATPPQAWNQAVASVKDIGEHMLQTLGGAMAAGAADRLMSAARQAAIPL